MEVEELEAGRPVGTGSRVHLSIGLVSHLEDEGHLYHVIWTFSAGLGCQALCRCWPLPRHEIPLRLSFWVFSYQLAAVPAQ